MFFRIITTTWLLALTAAQWRGQKRMDTAIENLRSAIVGKLNEAVDAIKDPNVDNEDAIAKLEALSVFVQNFDLTPDAPPETGEENPA